MPSERTIWLGATTVTIGILLLMLLQTRPEPRGAQVFRSIDNGATWRSLDGTGPAGIPGIPVHSIVVDPDDRQRLYLGTDLGVIVAIDVR